MKRIIEIRKMRRIDYRCKIGLHDFPNSSRWNWVVCKRHCLTEKNLKTGEVRELN